MKVLIIDDEIEICDQIRTMLTSGSKIDFQFDIVKDGLTALQKIKFIKFDLIISDIHMPNLTGLELERIKGSSENRDTPMIILSGDIPNLDYLNENTIVLKKPIEQKRLNRISKILRISNN